MAKAARAKVFGSEDLADAHTEHSIPPTGEARVESSLIEVVPSAAASQVIEDEAFMSEIVTVMIEPDDDPNAPLFIHTGHNGIDQYIMRGQPQRVKRKFLYSLIAAKKTQQACSFGKDGEGREFNRLNGRTNTTHRFSVLEDTPRGRAKIVQWMQQPA